MTFFVRHVTYSDLYLCNDTAGNLSSWYWGPKEQAVMYSRDVASQLIRSFPAWEKVIGVRQEEAVIELDSTPVTVAPPSIDSTTQPV